MSRTPKAENRKNLFLLVILAAFLLFTAPYLRIPLSIGEHTYAGGLYCQDTGELVETASLTLSGTRTYCLRRSGRSLEGNASVTIGSFSKDCRLGSRAIVYGCSGGWYDGPSYSLGSSALSTELLGDFQQGSFSYRKDFSAVVVALYQEDTPYFLSVTEEGSFLTPEETMASLQQARSKQSIKAPE